MKEDDVKQEAKEKAEAEKLAKSLKFKSVEEMKAKQKEELEEIAAKLLSDKKIFDPSQISADVKKEIERVERTGVGICSKCRFSSGCLKCDINKCRDYWMRLEREVWLQKVLKEKKAEEKLSSSSK